MGRSIIIGVLSDYGKKIGYNPARDLEIWVWPSGFVNFFLFHFLLSETDSN